MRATFHTDKFSYIVWGCLLGSMVILWIFASIKTIEALPGLYWSLGIFLFLYVWLFMFKLTISDKEICYRTLFGGLKTISRDSIYDYEQVFFKNMTLADRFKPPLRLIIKSKKNNQILEINMKVFSHKDLKQLKRMLDEDIEKNKEK